MLPHAVNARVAGPEGARRSQWFSLEG